MCSFLSLKPHVFVTPEYLTHAAPDGACGKEINLATNMPLLTELVGSSGATDDGLILLPSDTFDPHRPRVGSMSRPTPLFS